MIKFIAGIANYDVAPQAIFWRPLIYFCNVYEVARDDLDEYDGASFVIGNHISFDLRHYRGHPDFTVTLYLPISVRDTVDIESRLNEIIAAIALPTTAIAWRRGQDFEFGTLVRPQRDRLREVEARILALKIAATYPNYTATTEQIKKRVPEFIELSKKDLEKSKSRSREQLWQQIVGNVISHKGSSKGLFVRGLATRTKNGLSLTEKGLTYLKSLGFVS